MKSKFIKLIVLFMCLVTAFNIMSIGAFGAATATVSVDNVTAGESNLLVPINIKSSTKIMGFKISVRFDSEKVKVKGVSRGSVTAKGNFSTNYGVFESKFDVIWNNATEVDANGTLFVLTLDTTKSIKGCEIKISFSQPDTFNEAYEDVVLECSPIKILAKAQPTEQETDSTESIEETSSNSTETTTQITTEITYPENSQTADSVNNALDNVGADSIYDIAVEDKEEFVDSVNNNLNIMLGTEQEYYGDFNQIINNYENYYSDGFISDVIVSADAPVIKDSIDSALSDVGADNIQEVKDNQKFITLVENQMQKLNPDVKNISEYISEELALQTITKLYNTCQNTIDAFSDASSQSQQNQSKNNIIDKIWIIVFVSTFVLCVFIGLTVFVVGNKKKKIK